MNPCSRPCRFPYSNPKNRFLHTLIGHLRHDPRNRVNAVASLCFFFLVSFLAKPPGSYSQWMREPESSWRLPRMQAEFSNLAAVLGQNNNDQERLGTIRSCSSFRTLHPSLVSSICFVVYRDSLRMFDNTGVERFDTRGNCLWVMLGAPV